MERLTEKHEADAQRKEYERRLANGYPRNIPEERFLRLAAYEDTGLTPDEIKSMQGEHFSGLEMAKLYSALMELKKYQEADKDGRLVVLEKGENHG